MMTAKEILAKAKGYSVCSMLTGEETTEQLMQLVFTPQGMEFCTQWNFPDIDTLRACSGEQARSQGVYVDAHQMELDNPEKVLLAGDTQATLIYDDPCRSYHVVVMHGARVVIRASAYAVVFVKKTTGTGVEVVKLDNAIVDVR